MKTVVVRVYVDDYKKLHYGAEHMRRNGKCYDMSDVIHAVIQYNKLYKGLLNRYKDTMDTALHGVTLLDDYRI